MNDQLSNNSPSRDVLAGGRFHPAIFVLWLFAAAAIGVVAACMAREVESHVPPLLLLFPILVGVVVGALNVGLMRSMQMGNRSTAIFGVVLSAAVAVLGQHYSDYQRWAAAVADGRTATLSSKLSPRMIREFVSPPPGFADYLRRDAARGRTVARWKLQGWAAWLSWAMDGLLTLCAAVAMVVPAA